MSKQRDVSYQRQQVGALTARLAEPRRFLQVVAGPRQTGKTTLVRQTLLTWGERARYASADEPTLRDRAWIVAQWELGRRLARGSAKQGAVLALDEIQKVPGWHETVKRLWDEDTVERLPLHVVVLGSAPLLVQRGSSESLAGRFEILHVPHWSFDEMRAAFGFTLDQYVYFGGYPGSASLIGEPSRWARYIKDSLIETTVSRDVLLLSRVDKPALLRRLFELASRMSGQIVSYTKMLRQLQDAGNTTTLAHYLDLLAAAGLLTGLRKFSGSVVRQRGSSPKLQVLNNALVTAQIGISLLEAREDPATWGRLVESAVGAHLANAALAGECRVSYWRDRNREVDYVVEAGKKLLAIEVKTGRRREMPVGLGAFREAEKRARPVLIGGDGMPLEEALSHPVSQWL